MSQVLLTVRYRIAGDADLFRKAAGSVAPSIASADGLLWKIWGLDSEQRRGLSAYLFANQAAATKFAAGPIIERLRQRPDIAEVMVDAAPIDANLSALTGANHVLEVSATATAREPV